MTDRCADTRPHGPHEHYGQPAVLRRECPGVDNEGTRLVAALTAASFTTVMHGRGYVRMGWPGIPTGWPGSPELRGNLCIPTDDRYADYPDLLAAVLGELEFAASRGEAATRALDLHRKETP
jgi:hypothetical protein